MVEFNTTGARVPIIASSEKTIFLTCKNDINFGIRQKKRTN